MSCVGVSTHIHREASALFAHSMVMGNAKASINRTGNRYSLTFLLLTTYILLKVGAPKHEVFYMKKIFLSLLLAGLYGFNTIYVQAPKTVKSEMQESQARVLDVNPSTYVKPVIAELSVDTSKGRLRDTWTLNADELAARVIKNDDKTTLQNLRTYAVYKSSEKANCDVVIAATFDIRITDDGASITIVGYPANFTNWKTRTIADYDWIRYEPSVLTLETLNQLKCKNPPLDLQS